MFKLNTWFDFLKITLASPECLKKWGASSIINKKGISNEELLSTKTLKPARNGLFCEQIFGPIKSWECFCGKYKTKPLNNIKFCNICGFELNLNSSRKYRLGYIQLYSSVTHIWYLKGIPSIISLILNINLKVIEKIVYFSNYAFFLKNQNLLHKIFNEINFDFYFYDHFTGASAIKYLLQQLNLQSELFRSRLMIHLLDISYLNNLNIYNYKNINNINTREKLIKRIRLLENFIATKSHPSWMILDILPVLPPLLRPLLPDDNCGLIISDLNKLYLNIIKYNNSLFYSSPYEMPLRIKNNEYRLLQESVDILIDNRQQTKIHNTHKISLKSLSTRIIGKQGRFRQNLLGKRVDYSGRSVIVVGPFLKLNQCGLPFKISIELFQPFLIRQLLSFKIAQTIEEAKIILIKEIEFISFILIKLFKKYLILLNRAPTLHRLGIQAFEPLLVFGKAIMLHPLVCSAFNADFDGDQMSIHIPLTIKTQEEAKFLLFAPNNILSSTNGFPIISPSQDIVIGLYYLTVNNLIITNFKNNYFNTYKEILIAYEQQQITLQSLIWIRFSIIFDLTKKYIYSQLEQQTFKLNKYIQITFGRLLLNQNIKKNLYT